MHKTKKIEDFLLTLRDEIVSGRWQVGDKLPPEEYFMEHFQVSRTLLREAMKLLIAEGVIVRRHGSGTYLQVIPKKRIELYVRLENIISMGANWFRWQIDYLKRKCRNCGYELEVLVSCGDTPGREAASFQRHLNCPLMPDVVGSLIFFFCPELEARLTQRGGHFVTVTTVYGASFADSAVVLDYEKMGQLMKLAVARYNASHPCLVCIDDAEDIVGSTVYREMHHLHDTVMPDKSCQLLIHSYETMEQQFGAWLEKNGETCDLLVFVDDEVAKIAFGIMGRSGRKYPDLSCITHGNAGLFSLHKPDIKSLEVIGFGLQQVADAAWKLVNSPQKDQLIKIAPDVITENGGNEDAESFFV